MTNFAIVEAYQDFMATALPLINIETEAQYEQALARISHEGIKESG